MAIELITGSPGGGKTLFTLFTVEKRRKNEYREVYYYGINDLQLPWIPFENPEHWFKLPNGSIIVIDEAQKLFRPRSALTKTPEYVSELETHRHHGFDIYLITQHPTLIETNVRRLVETHHHLMRKFGAKWVTIHSWKGVKENCDKTRKDSQRIEFKYPKEVFSWYKSAEVHTHKFSLPLKLKLALLIPVITIFAAYFGYKNLTKLSSSKEEATQINVKDDPNQSGSRNKQLEQLQTRYEASKEDMWSPYNAAPRYADMPWTARRYDGLTTPTVVPVVVGCIYQASTHFCRCITQQGTRANVSLNFCREYASGNTPFIDFQVDQASLAYNSKLRDSGRNEQLQSSVAGAP